MPKVVERKMEHGGKVLKTQWHFRCPGCHHVHAVGTEHHKFNGNLDRPTFTPSLLVDWAGVPRCHSYITDGRIQFLPDCEHELKGKTVDLPEWVE